MPGTHNPRHQRARCIHTPCRMQYCSTAIVVPPLIRSPIVTFSCLSLGSFFLAMFQRPPSPPNLLFLRY